MISEDLQEELKGSQALSKLLASKAFFFRITQIFVFSSSSSVIEASCVLFLFFDR